MNEARRERFAAVPLELRERPQWVCWMAVWNEAKGKLDKQPFQALRPARHASSTNPKTWTTFDEAIAALERHGYDGVGFVFSPDDPYAGVDLDSGLTEADRAAIVLALDSYTETSPSGNGYHVLLRGSLNGHGRNRKGPFEVYDQGRYFTVTGQHVVGTPVTVEERQVELDQLLERVFPPKAHLDARPNAPTAHLNARLNGPTAAVRPAVDLDDQELLERASTAANGDKFRALWNGQWEGQYGSQSEADSALCSLLGFWTGRDHDRVDRMFRASGLSREKWDSRRGESTYGQQTITNALGLLTEVYDPPSRTSSERTRPSKSVVSAAEKTGVETNESTHDDPISHTPSGSPLRFAPGSPRPSSPVRPSPSGEGRTQTVRPGFAPSSPQNPHTWIPIDLVAASASPPTPPEIISLFYPGYNHLLSGESEALKTWLALAASATELQAGRGVIWVDGDDVGKGALLERLRLLGADDDSIARLFAYMLPDEPITDESQADVLEVVGRLACRLAVFDGFNPLLHMHGLDPNSGADVESFYGLIDPIRKAGAANVLTDNVVKASEARGAWAIGSERKKSKAEVHLGMKTLEPFVRGGIGRAKIAIHKDRPGHLIRPSPGILVLESRDDGCSWHVQPDDSRGAEGTFRPTKLMENVSRYLERSGDEPQSHNQILSAKLGKKEYVRAAITCLIEEGYALEFSSSNRARLVQLERPFREGEESDL